MGLKAVLLLLLQLVGSGLDRRAADFDHLASAAHSIIKAC